MKRKILALAIASLPATGALAADCTGGGSQLDAPATLTQKTVCGTNGTDSWQEYHHADGRLEEYARGTNPIDPTHEVGTWQADGTAIRYIYAGGAQYRFELWQNGSNMALCGDGGQVVTVTALLNTQTGCSAAPL